MNKPEPPRKSSKQLLWSLLFLAIAAATVWAVAGQNRNFSPEAFWAYVRSASKPWLAAAVCGMLGFIVFEGEALIHLCRAFGYAVPRRRGFAYSAADLYFSAITPSATGGQPACAYFMIKDGVSGAAVTILLLLNLTMYTASILVLGTAVLLIRPDVFLSFGALSRALIALGYAVQALLAALFLLLLTKGNLLHRVCGRALHFLCGIRLLRHEEEKRRKLALYMEEYAACARMIRGHRAAMAKCFLCNLLQRASVISVSFFALLASGGGLGRAAEIWAVQCYAVIGSNTIPIPGAMGVSDYIMLDGFGNVMSQQAAVAFELLSRGLSFYVCIALCGITTLITYWLLRKRERRL